MRTARTRALVADRPRHLAQRVLAAKIVSVRFVVTRAKRGPRVARTKFNQCGSKYIDLAQEKQPKVAVQLVAAGGDKKIRAKTSRLWLAHARRNLAMERNLA